MKRVAFKLKFKINSLTTRPEQTVATFHFHSLPTDCIATISFRKIVQKYSKQIYAEDASKFNFDFCQQSDDSAAWRRWLEL